MAIKANPKTEVNNSKPAERHFAWELFSAGQPVKRNGKDLHEIPVAVQGAWVKGGHRFSITPEDLRDMVQNFEKRKNDCVVIDYEHASERPEVALGGPVPAAGWIHQLFVGAGFKPAPGAGMGGDRDRAGYKPALTMANSRAGYKPASTGESALRALVEWTPDAKSLIERGQYRFFSPSVDWEARDKASGVPQGATLTSGALTNHPFLEELPPLMLTDLAAAPAGKGKLQKVTTVPEFDPGRGKGDSAMEMKRLSIRKLTDGPQAGSYGIFSGDEPLGYITSDDWALESGGGGDPDDANSEDVLCASFAERVGASGTALSEIRGLIEAGRRALETESEGASRRLILSEVLKDGRLRTERALELARERKITLSDYVAVQAAERALDRAVLEGKVLPRDRHFFFRDAFERPREFAGFVERAAPVVRFRPDGLGSGEAVPVDQEVDLGARRLMSEKKISYGKALKALFRENAALESRYRAAHSRRVETDPNPGGTGSGLNITQ